MGTMNLNRELFSKPIKIVKNPPVIPTIYPHYNISIGSIVE